MFRDVICSPLKSVCRRFLSSSKSVGLFCIPELVTSKGFVELERRARRRCDDLIREVFNPNKTRKVVAIVDDLSDTICQVADLAECLRNVHPNPDFVLSADQCLASLSSLVERFNTDADLYSQVKRNVNQGDDVDRRVASLFVIDFEASGVHLNEKKRADFVQTTEDIFQLSSEFVRRCEEPRIISVRSSGAKNAEMFETVDNPCLFSDNPSSRENGYKTYYRACDEQERTLCELLQLRRHLARISDFPTYAHRALRGSLLETPEKVEKLLISLIDRLRPLAERDLKILNTLNISNKGISTWDTAYLTYLAKKAYLGDTWQAINEYFDLNTCLYALNRIVNQLYDVTLERVKPSVGEVWRDDVSKFVVKNNENGEELGSIYCDWYDESTKTTGESHFTVRCGRKLSDTDGTYQNPIVVLSFRHQKQAAPRLSINEVENVLHEFGHAFHSVLSRTRYQHASGTRSTTDFVEIPSTLMENYLNDERTLPLFTKHWKSGQQLDVDSIRKIRTSLNLFAAPEMLRQAVYALFDLRIHSISDEGFFERNSTVDVFNKLCDETWPFMRVDSTAWHHRFSHLVHYGSKYNAYTVAAASAKNIWSRCFNDNPLSRNVGRQWREVQSFGGERSPVDLLNLVLHSSFTVDSLVDTIVKNV